ncbi:MAG TPA: prolipoprotein diacylglyceryl transferase [Candidatus Limnocylindrales bacterium]|jgi:phosphatidylglycerol:prolipoprotein diacylglycerol transferase
MFDLTPSPIAIQIGPFPLHWYGICYAVGLAAVYLLVTRLAARAGRDPALVGNGMIVVAVAALIGGRLYHVIDQWALYEHDLLRIVLPPYSGLGVYGGLATGTIAAFVFLRRHREPFWVWADIVAPGLFLMQAIGRWGNFFNQELYGPPTPLPWGIPIDCAHRVAEFACSAFPEATTRFHPLFLYESLSGLLGMVTLIWIGTRFRDLVRAGDLLLGFFIWYSAVRFTLETLRSGNWTFFGIPTAMLVSLLVIAVAGLAIVLRHRRSGSAGGAQDRDPSSTSVAAGDGASAGDRSATPESSAG